MLVKWPRCMTCLENCFGQLPEKSIQDNHGQGGQKPEQVAPQPPLPLSITAWRLSRPGSVTPRQDAGKSHGADRPKLGPLLSWSKPQASDLPLWGQLRLPSFKRSASHRELCHICCPALLTSACELWVRVQSDAHLKHLNHFFLTRLSTQVSTHTAHKSDFDSVQSR